MKQFKLFVLALGFALIAQNIKATTHAAICKNKELGGVDCDKQCAMSGFLAKWTGDAYLTNPAPITGQSSKRGVICVCDNRTAQFAKFTSNVPKRCGWNNLEEGPIKVYSKAVGDFVSIPLGQAYVESVKSYTEYNEIQNQLAGKNIKLVDEKEKKSEDKQQ